MKTINVRKKKHYYMITTVIGSHLYPTQTWSISVYPLFRGPLPSFLRYGILSIKINKKKKNVTIDFLLDCSWWHIRC